MSNYESVVAIGLVPNRSDGMISLHVGSSWIMLNMDEARRLKTDLECKLADSEIIRALHAPQGAAQPMPGPIFTRKSKHTTEVYVFRDERSGKERRCNYFQCALYLAASTCSNRRKSQRRSASPVVK